MKFPESLKVLTDTLWRIQDREDLSGALEDILTPAEITEIADRIVILRLLSEGKSQREIADTLGTSVTTVSRGNRVLKYERKSIHKYI